MTQRLTPEREAEIRLAVYDELRARVIAQTAAAPIRAVLEAAIRAAVDVTPKLETPEATLLACETTLYDALMHGLD